LILPLLKFSHFRGEARAFADFYRKAKNDLQQKWLKNHFYITSTQCSRIFSSFEKNLKKGKKIPHGIMLFDKIMLGKLG
jgi:hypothetical protein